MTILPTLPTPQSVGLGVDSEAEVARMLAEYLRARGKDRTFIKSLMKKFTYAEYVSFMLWDLLVHGTAHFSNGETFEIVGYDDWLKTAKFVFSHLDGPARDGATFNQINLFKVYAGFDPDRV